MHPRRRALIFHRNGAAAMKPSYQNKGGHPSEAKQPDRAAADTADSAQESAGSELLEGRNAVLEALRAGRTIDKLYLLGGSSDPALGRIAALAREAGAVVVTADRHRLDAMSAAGVHQGVIASVAAHSFSSVDDMLALAESRGQPPLLILCDELSDPHNLGAIIRTAECAGAHGVIIPKRRSAGLTATVAKASAGAIEYLPVARVANLTAAIVDLQQRGLWVFGAAADGEQTIYQADFSGPTALVIGSEGSGMSRLVSRACDVRVSIPMVGHIGSLNASVAAAIVLYEAVRQRTVG